ncbi:hypothetical protein BJV77DRAFT_397562 [Russula vinacea]|nr:hypothetical protein BJV77DRAFT_397562 [Russula vinacea]
MAIAPPSLPPFSHFHPSSSPLAIPFHTPNEFSTRKSNFVLSIPHFSRVEEGRAHELPREVAMDWNSAFHSSHSRVLRFYNLPPLPSIFLHGLFLDTARDSKSLVPIPKSLWARRAGCEGIGPSDGVWAVFGTHEEVMHARPWRMLRRGLARSYISIP